MHSAASAQPFAYYVTAADMSLCEASLLYCTVDLRTLRGCSLSEGLSTVDAGINSVFILMQACVDTYTCVHNRDIGVKKQSDLLASFPAQS